MYLMISVKISNESDAELFYQKLTNLKKKKFKQRVHLLWKILQPLSNIFFIDPSARLNIREKKIKMKKFYFPVFTTIQIKSASKDSKKNFQNSPLETAKSQPLWQKEKSLLRPDNQYTYPLI
ncbi:hypothetical protein BpHYR1_015986 [Brachionus plicatilis]|uniref:Uncharacterized protein n=1 Tax=Brachionus plicatilis TaxID=10195 RepID=A0A3M7PB68_BRAPC|nr:hypothetical protein BpHYR1_015986 [Brachionus plicatilis]